MYFSDDPEDRKYEKLMRLPPYHRSRGYGVYVFDRRKPTIILCGVETPIEDTPLAILLLETAKAIGNTALYIRLSNYLLECEESTMVTKDLKSPLPSTDAMSYAFMSHRPISPQKFSKLCDSIATDNRITALIEFDFEDGTVGVCQSSDNAWWYYDLKDVSNAVFRADRKNGLRLDTREELFNAALEGKELDVYEEETQDEDASPAMQM